jgi:hypothetical protein
MLNAYAYRSTQPRGLWLADDPVGQDNDRHLIDEGARAGTILAAWGNHCHPDRARWIKHIVGRDLFCLARNKSGAPMHPLYSAKSSALKPYYTH